MGHFTDREIIQPPYEQRIEFIEHGTDTPMPPLCHQLTDIGEEFAPRFHTRSNIGIVLCVPRELGAYCPELEPQKEQTPFVHVQHRSLFFVDGQTHPCH